MNTLSLFLYLADVLYQQVAFITFLCILSPFVYLMARLAAVKWADASWNWDDEALKERKRAERARPFITTYKFFIYPLVGLFLLSLVPSKDTFYLIAASEVGEMVVNTSEAQEIMSSLQEILNVQLNKLKEAE